MLFVMSNPAKELTPFGRTIQALIDDHGFPSRATFAKHTGVPQSTISRWMTDPTITPEPHMLARVADKLTVRRIDRDRLYGQLMAAAGHITEGPAADDKEELPAQARDVIALLGDGSPLDERERQRLGELLDILLRSYRKLPHTRAAS